MSPNADRIRPNIAAVKVTKGLLVKTTALCTSYISLGMSVSLFGTTLPHMERLFGTSLSLISLTFVAGGGGYLVGSVLCGVVLDKINNELLIAIASLLLALSTAIAPWLRIVYLFFIAMGLEGMAMGFLDSAQPTFCLSLWKDHRLKDPVLQAMHVCWTLGAALSPLIIRYFLVPLSFSNPLQNNETTAVNSTFEIINTNNITASIAGASTSAIYSNFINLSNNVPAENYSSSASNVTIHGDIGLVRYAYVTIGFFALCSATFLFLVFVMSKETVRKSLTRHKSSSLNHVDRKLSTESNGLTNGTTSHHKSNQNHNNNKIASEEKAKKKLLRFRLFLLGLILGVIFFFTYYVCVFSQLLPTFVHKGLGWTTDRGALAATALWLGLLGGRILSVPVSLCIRAKYLLLVNICLMSTSLAIIVAATLLRLDEAVVWTSVVVGGLGMSTFFPCCILWTSTLMKFDGKVGASLQVASSLGSMSSSAFVGYLFDLKGHMAMIYFLVAADCLVIVLVACTNLTARIFKRKLLVARDYDRISVEVISSQRLTNGLTTESNDVETTLMLSELGEDVIVQDKIHTHGV